MVIAVESRPQTGRTDSEKFVHPSPEASGSMLSGAWAKRFGWTLGTSIAQFAIFFLQGIVVANVLGPEARGEFGAILFFPRDLLLYVGLFGGVEMISSLAARKICGATQLRIAAIKLALVTSALTGFIAAICAVLFLWWTNRLYLFPLASVTLLFLVFEHLQLIVSGVDRGVDHFTRYNWNRLIHAATFPAAVLLIFGCGINDWVPGNELAWVCAIFVVSRVLGVLPTLLPATQTETLPSHWVQAPGIVADLRPAQLLKQGMPFSCSMLATEVFERLDVLLVLLLASLTESGNYLVAVPAAALATLVPNTLGLFAFNAGAKRSLKLSGAQWLGIVAGLLVVQLVTVVLLWLLLPKLIPLFFGPRFEQAISFALWLLPACALKGYLQFADGYLKGMGASGIGIRTRIIAVGVLLACVGLSYSRMELYSIPLAAGVAQAFCSIVLTIALFRSGSWAAESDLEGGR